jgi:predicted transcriptional regulator
MKTYIQFLEDIESRRKELHQRSIDSIQANKERQAQIVQDRQNERDEKLERAETRKRIKKEIKQELGLE